LRARVHGLGQVVDVELPDNVPPALAPEATPLGKIYCFRLNSDRHDRDKSD